MQRIILACVLAVLATCGHAADKIIYYGPSGELLPDGKYTRVVITWQNGQAVMTQQTVLEVGVGPVPPTPPPVDDVSAKVAGLIAAVTADPTKADTSKGLAMAYGKILELTRDKGERDTATIDALPPEALRELAGAAIIKDVATLRKAAEAVIDAMLADPKVGKTATWKPFTDGMKALASPLDFAGVVNLYTIAQAQLRGGPVPPPFPPPPPVTTAVKAAILIESENQTAQQATLIAQMRNDKSWSKLLSVLDPDQQTEANQPDPQTSAIKAAIGSRPLPRLVLLNSDGAFVADEDLPATWDAAKTLLTSKGVKP